MGVKLYVYFKQFKFCHLHLFTSVFQALHNVIDVWGDASVLKHTSYEKHLYLSKAILVCLAFVEDEDKAKLKTGKTCTHICHTLYYLMLMSFMQDFYLRIFSYKCQSKCLIADQNRYVAI